MAYATSALHPRELDFIEASTQPQPSLFERLLDALVTARARQVEGEIARYLVENTGGKMTDQAEREIETRFLSNPTRW